MPIRIYKASDSFIFIFGFSESLKKTLFKDLFPEILMVKVAENEVFTIFSVKLASIIFWIRSFNKFLID